MSLRAYLRLLAAMLWLLICIPGWALAWPLGRHSFWVSLFLRRTARLLGMRIAIEGTPLEGRVLFVANHISWLDILALGGATRARFVAKAEIARWPLVGWLAKIGGTVFIDRERRAATREQADALADALAEARPIALFAEGGTGDGLVVTPFRAALFASAVKAGVEVQPVAIDYGPERARIAWPDDVSFAREAQGMLNRRERVPVTLRFLAPLDPVVLDRKALATTSRAAIVGALR